ncbi:flotillin family protein [Salinisphaera sp. Q1T1-3]|uniref:SPFH domain-containing protein n=1 Tax=Salinisphaera sp. Q1T1-3 TaxID=2321229 RepID=UPI000E720610|nr:flotillin family protein [Salinisphaera sp. Q1T1-3]RJS94148.1 flotillin family protein [Salinisphaera sp. Q1T1-3]
MGVDSGQAPALLGFATAGGIAVLIFLILVGFLRLLVRVCPPNHVMVIQGAKTTVNGKTYGFRVILGGRAIVIPFLHRAELLDLSVLPINVRVEGVNSANGITVGADATACVCVDVEDQALLFTAVERMLGKSRAEIQDQIQQTMIGNFRGAMNRTTPLEAMGMVESVEKVQAGELPEADENTSVGEGERAHFRQEMLEDANEDLSSFGMKVVSVSFQRIWDSSDYISNLATKAVAHKRQEVEVQEARLAAVAESAESDSERRQAIAKARADEAIVEAQQRLGLVEQECNARIAQARQEADAGIDEASSTAQSKVETARSELQEYKNSSDVTLKPEKERLAAEILARGDNDAVNILRGVRNELLERKATLLASAGANARVPLFVQQQLGSLFDAYADGAKNLRLDNLTFMGDGDDDGVNAAVNRGPAGLVNFLEQFEQAFGISIKQFMSTGEPAERARAAEEG